MRRGTEAILLAVAVASAATLICAAPTSIDFDSNGTVFSGDPIHTAGMSLPGQTGAWHRLVMNGSGQSSTLDTGSGVFTFNTTLLEFRGYLSQEGDPLRDNFFWLNGSTTSNTIIWSVTGLVPHAIYNVICYSTYVVNYKYADFTIDGYNDGNPVPQEDGSTNDEGDHNFPLVEADDQGRIMGSFSIASTIHHAEFAGIQWELVALPPPKGTVIRIK